MTDKPAADSPAILMHAAIHRTLTVIDVAAAVTSSHHLTSTADGLMSAAADLRAAAGHAPPQEDPLKLVHDLWWFIESATGELPGRTDLFFELRERVRSVPAPLNWRVRTQAAITQAPARSLLESLTEYVKRFADLNGEPEDGDCHRTIADARRVLEAKPTMADDPLVMLGRLLEWEVATGGWDAPVWTEAARLHARLSGKPHPKGWDELPESDQED